MRHPAAPSIRRILAVSLAAAALVAAGCSGDDADDTPTTTEAEAGPVERPDGVSEGTPNQPRVDEELCWLAIDPNPDFERVAELLPEELRDQMRDFAAQYQAWEDSDRDPELQPEPPAEVFAHIAQECTPDEVQPDGG